MSTKEVVTTVIGAALGWYLVAHRMKTGKNY